MKKFEWTHDQILKDRQLEKQQMDHQIQELKRKHESEESKIKDEVEKLWRSKLADKDAQIKAIESEFESKRIYLNEDLTTKDYQLREINENFTELKAKVITFQVENDDLRNQLTLGRLDQNSTIEKQKVKIESLQNDLLAIKQAHQEDINDVSMKIEQRTTKQLQDKFEYDLKGVTDRHKLELERVENNYKFQLRQSDDRQRDLERENYNIKGKLEKLENKLQKIELEMSSEKFEKHDRELLDAKHNLQDKTNKLFLIKEKLQTTELNLESKVNEVKQLRHENTELISKLDQFEANKKKSTNQTQNLNLISLLQRKVEELENQIKESQNKPEKLQKIVKNKGLKKDDKIPFVEKPYNNTKKSKGSAFDDLNLDDDDFSDGLFDRDLNETERLKNLKPDQETENNQELSKLHEENIELKLIISQMKDEMIAIQKAHFEATQSAPNSEMTFFKNSNKKLLSQLEAEHEKFEVLQAELDVKTKELDIANSSITNMSKKLLLKDQDIEVLIQKLKEQREIVNRLKGDRDQLEIISNRLKGQLHYR